MLYCLTEINSGTLDDIVLDCSNKSKDGGNKENVNANINSTGETMTHMDILEEDRTKGRFKESFA